MEGGGGGRAGLWIGERAPGDEAFGVDVFEDADFFWDDAAGDGKFKAEVGEGVQQFEVFLAQVWPLAWASRLRW